jgi:tetratricopeptide (TPR) repeat protein
LAKTRGFGDRTPKPAASLAEAARICQEGNALQSLKRWYEAIAIYNKALVLKPDYAEAYNNRGVALKELKQLDEAIASYDKAIALKPDYAAAYSNRGNALKDLKRLDEALASYDKAIALKPDYARAYSNRGVALNDLKRFSEAIASCDKAIALNPAYAEAYNHRGNALKNLKRLDEAIVSYDNAIALKPDYAEAFGNRGNALKDLKRLDDALASYDNALALKPGSAELYSNRGNVLQDLKRPDEALASYDKAIALKPDYAEAYNNRGVALSDLARFDEAIASYDRAIALKPDYADASWNKALAYLRTRRFDVGWRDYEARKRKKMPVANRTYAKPLWLGDSDVSGKRILVHWEQGLGDTIQFCRYIKLLEDAGATVIFAPQTSLKVLMRSLAAKAQLADADDPTLSFDFHCPLMSLPLAFKTDLATIPRAKNYLSALDDKVMTWAHRLGEKTKPRVGVVWSGSAENAVDDDRSIELEIFRQVFDERFQFVSLQKDVRDKDKAWLENAKIPYFGDALDDFTDTAALCHVMDLVISVDTSVAHLAAALGKAVWVLLPWFADWRWMLDRDDSPWYPSMRLFRQKIRGDWDGVFQRIDQELRSLHARVDAFATPA